MIRKAKISEIKSCIKVAKGLKEWFTEEAIQNMRIDFKVNPLIVAIDKNKICGFLCYSALEGEIILNWIGVEKNAHKKGIGKNLLLWLDKKSRLIGAKKIKVETLSEDEMYEPYEATREFYKKNGFVKVRTKLPEKKGWDKMDVLEKKIK